MLVNLRSMQMGPCENALVEECTSAPCHLFALCSQFCNSSKSVTATLDFEKELGTVSCNQCHQTHQQPINHLTEAIDL